MRKVICRRVICAYFTLEKLTQIIEERAEGYGIEVRIMNPVLSGFVTTVLPEIKPISNHFPTNTLILMPKLNIFLFSVL